MHMEKKNKKTCLSTAKTLYTYKKLGIVEATPEKIKQIK